MMAPICEAFHPNPPARTGAMRKSGSTSEKRMVKRLRLQYTRTGKSEVRGTPRKVHDALPPCCSFV